MFGPASPVRSACQAITKSPGSMATEGCDWPSSPGSTTIGDPTRSPAASSRCASSMVDSAPVAVAPPARRRRNRPGHRSRPREKTRRSPNRLAPQPSWRAGPAACDPRAPRPRARLEMATCDGHGRDGLERFSGRSARDATCSDRSIRLVKCFDVIRGDGIVSRSEDPRHGGIDAELRQAASRRGPPRPDHFIVTRFQQYEMILTTRQALTQGEVVDSAGGAARRRAFACETGSALLYDRGDARPGRPWPARVDPREDEGPRR